MRSLTQGAALPARCGLRRAILRMLPLLRAAAATVLLVVLCVPQVRANTADTVNSTGPASPADAVVFRGAVERNATADTPGAASGQKTVEDTQRQSGEGAQQQTAAEPPRFGKNGESQLPSSGWGNYFQAIGILLFILGALYMGVWTLKRFGKLRGAGGGLGRNGLSVEGQFHIGPKKSLVVVRFLNKRLLLGVTDQQINLLTEMEADNEPTQQPKQPDFAELLDGAGDKDTAA